MCSAARNASAWIVAGCPRLDVTMLLPSQTKWGRRARDGADLPC
jgi:hypothetical protein